MDTSRLPRHATKIVATLGPASNTPELIEQMIVHKVSVVRLNFSHGTAQDHIDRAAMVREAARRAGREVAIMATWPAGCAGAWRWASSASVC